MKTSRRVLTAAALIAPLVALTPTSPIEAVAPPDAPVFISELHYDNVSTDAGEAIEVAGPVGTDLSTWSLVLYNGSNGTVYNTIALSGTLTDLADGYGVSVTNLPSNGLQNGGPDGIALVNDATVVQFLSYEGAFTAVGGPADGELSTDIGVSESSSTPAGASLQLTGTGSCPGALTWAVADPNTFGSLGFDPDDTVPCVPSAEVDITEFHYDNDGTDVGEAIEIRATSGVDLGGWSIVRYNGSNGLTYGTDSLSGVLSDDGDGFGTTVVSYPSNGLQNGAPDGIALVGPEGVDEFWSYEGSFTAVDGPAAGLTSVDVDVAEAGSTPIGLSLQRNGDVWSGPACASFGAVNDPAAPPACPDPPAVLFSEIHYDNAGTDADEAIEVTGIAGTDLTDWSIVLYNGNGGGVYNTTALSGVLADQDGGFGTAVVAYSANGVQNGSPDGFALIDATGTTVEFLSYEGSMVATDGPAVGLSSTDIGVSQASAVVGTSLQRDAAGSWSGPKCASFGEINDPFAPDVCPLEVKIHEVQGNGLESPLVGVRVIVEGIVVGDEEGAAPALRGFFVQEEDGDTDSDLTSSEGVFVFNFNNDDVNVGDLVRVEATVEEFFGNTQLGTFAEVEVLSSSNPLPTAADIMFPVASIVDLEAYEGMLATLSDTLVISEYFNYDRFGEIVVAKPVDGLGAARVMNPTAVYAPSDPAAAELRDLNLRSRITVDDGNSFQNPDVNIHPINREQFSLDNSFRGGDTVTGLSGPILYSFNRYRILPLGDYNGDDVNDGFADYTRNPAPAAPDDVGGDLRVASLNALNYFVSLDTADTCGPTLDQDCRGADDQGEYERQHVKLMNALVGLDADVVGLVELENTPGVEALEAVVDGQDGDNPVAGLNDLLGDGTYAYVAAGVDSQVGNDTIKVGVIYRPDAVTPLGEPEILDTPEFVDPLGVGDDKNRAAVAQSFIDNATGEVFSVVVNHFKSKGSPCGEAGEGGLTGSCNLTRTAAAGALADWITTSPTGVADDDWLILGDLNAYDKEDPIVALQTAGYTDLIGQYGDEFAYSYVFDGEVGYLDYIMSSDSMTAQVTGATEWHINSDEPDIVDYDTSFKSDPQDAFFDPTTPFRASDHDAALIGLSLDSFDATVVAIPDTLWAPNHKLYDIELVATLDSGVADTVAALSATSSEADSGLGDDDVPNDISIVEGDIQLRGERFSKDGRTYTIQVAVVSDGQTVVVEGVEVTVAHDQRAKKPRRNSTRVR